MGWTIQDPDNISAIVDDNLCGFKLHLSSGLCNEESIGKNVVANLKRINPETMLLETSATEIAEVSISETYYPGWVYRLDGETETHPVRMDDAGFMMIPNIQPGDQRVEIFYEPSHEKLGFILTIISFVLGGAFILFMDKRSRL